MQPITTKFQTLGGAAGVLGKPEGAEQVSADGVGRFRRFQNGAIYWHPTHGAFSVVGVIHDAWVKSGSERGTLGYPVTDQLISGDGRSRCSCFQRGRIYQLDQKVWTTDLSSDAALLAWVDFQARPLSVDWLEQYLEYGPLPPSIDYGADANFVRNQGTLKGGLLGGGGCMTYALLHIIDILKDWEHPYTPALSLHFVAWFAQTFQAQYGHPPDTLQAQAAYGYASEALCPTNWDTLWTPSGVWQEPSQAAKDEATFYRAMIVDADMHQCTAEDPEQAVMAIKQALRAYGPVWCSSGEHARAIIGYNDNTHQFKLIDSYPHESNATGGHNILYLDYQEVGPGKQISNFLEITNIPNNARLAGRYAYSARIAIDSEVLDGNYLGGNWRGTYNVRIGVEGREPLEVWTTRGRDVNPETALEYSRFLRIDVPLPEYAAECWPPSSEHRWFLEVEDCDRDGRGGTITEFTLARRYVHPSCQSVGKYRTEAYGGPLSVKVPDPSSGPTVPARFGPGWPPKTPNPNPGRVSVTVSTGNADPAGHTLSLALSLTLPSNQVVINGNQVTLKGTLKYKWSGTPVVGKEVKLCRVRHNTCVNKPATWIGVGQASTDSSGNFSFHISLDQYKAHMYAAVYYSPEGEVMASSAPLLFSNNKLIVRKDWAQALPKLLPVDVRELVLPVERGRGRESLKSSSETSLSAENSVGETRPEFVRVGPGAPGEVDGRP